MQSCLSTVWHKPIDNLSTAIEKCHYFCWCLDWRRYVVEVLPIHLNRREARLSSLQQLISHFCFPLGFHFRVEIFVISTAGGSKATQHVIVGNRTGAKYKYLDVLTNTIPHDLQYQHIHFNALKIESKQRTTTVRHDSE